MHLLTNTISYGVSGPNSFTHFLPFFDSKLGRLVSMKEISELGLDTVSSEAAFLRKGLTPVYASAKDNLKLVKEMIDYLKKGDIFQYNQEVRDELNTRNIWGALSSSTLELL
jgi:hypothetical protein